MQKAEAQRNHAQSQRAQGSGGKAALESPQGEQLAQLEAMADASPQVEGLAQLAAVANNNPAVAAQLRLIDGIHNGPSVTVQQQAGHTKGCGCQSCATQQSTQTMNTKRVVQRYCNVPGCDDPKCDDPRNHGSGYRRLRNVHVYTHRTNPRRFRKGSNTNQNVRDYVQDPNAYYPEEVSIAYSTRHRRHSGYGSYIQPVLGPGEKPDAGHIRGNQYGGSGRDRPNIFAQHPQFNRGHIYNGERTHDNWRGPENEIARLGKRKRVKSTVKLYDKKRRHFKKPTKKEKREMDILAEHYLERNKLHRRWYDDDKDKGGGIMT